MYKIKIKPYNKIKLIVCDNMTCENLTIQMFKRLKTILLIGNTLSTI